MYVDDPLFSLDLMGLKALHSPYQSLISIGFGLILCVAPLMILGDLLLLWISLVYTKWPLLSGFPQMRDWYVLPLIQEALR